MEKRTKKNDYHETEIEVVLAVWDRHLRNVIIGNPTEKKRDWRYFRSTRDRLCWKEGCLCSDITGETHSNHGYGTARMVTLPGVNYE